MAKLGAMQCCGSKTIIIREFNLVKRPAKRPGEDRPGNTLPPLLPSCGESFRMNECSFTISHRTSAAEAGLSFLNKPGG